MSVPDAYTLTDGRRVYPAFLLNSESGGGIVTPPASFRLSDGRGVTAIVLVDESGNIVASPDGAIETAFTDLDPWVTGKYYDIGMMDSLSSTGGVALVADTLHATLIKVPHTITIDQLACYVSVGAAAGKKLRLGLYANSASNLPGALIVDGGEVAADGTGTVAVTVDETLARGRYWVAAVSDGTPTLTFYKHDTSGRFVSGLTNLGHGASVHSYTVTAAHTFGALPASFGAATIYNTNAIRLGVRVS